MSAAELARRHRIPPPAEWAEWVGEVRDYLEADWRLDLCARYVAALRRSSTGAPSRPSSAA